MNCLRGAGWKFKRKGKRQEIWKKKGSTDRLNLPTNKSLPESQVRVILNQAGLPPDAIDGFLRASVKDS